MSAASIRAAIEAREDRKARIAQWIREGVHDLEKFEGEVMWGLWKQVGGEDSNPPDAIFPTEETASAFATMLDLEFDFHIGPVLVDLQTRDNFEVPR